MTRTNTLKPDPKLDLVFERIADAPRELLWAAWTRPELLMQWFTPAPWKTIACEIDLRPGGKFSSVMQSPEGERFPNTGCYLEVVENEKLVWTDALQAGYRPSMDSLLGFFITATLTFEAHGKGTKYTVIVSHKDEASVKKHADIGFQDGWGKAFEQLIALVTKK